MLEMLGNDVLELNRKSLVRLSRLLIPYPIENNLSSLSQEDRIDALTSFLEAWKMAKEGYVPKNLKEWVYGFFGKWIADNYLVPYNLKIWKRPLEEIDVDWVYVQGRLPIPDWKDVVKSAIGQPTIGYVEQSRFYYPKYGGIYRLYEAVLRKLVSVGVRYVKGYKIVSIRQTKDGWLINDRLRAKRLVASIPLNELVKLMEAPEHIIELSNWLDYNRLLVVGLAINRPAPEQHWVYVSTPGTIFHRYAWISNYSPFNAPQNRSTLIAEVTIPPGQQVNIEKHTEEALKGLEELEVVKSKEVIFVRSWLHEYGYPVHTIASNRAREQIVRWLLEQGVTPIGRWGCWQYWNMDKVYENVLAALRETDDVER